MKVKSKLGLTLIELIVAIAILGIVFIAFQDMFFSGFRTIFSSGQRTQAVMDVQNITDDLNNQKFTDRSGLVTYLTGKGYYVAASKADAQTYHSKSVNCYIDGATATTLNGVKGYPVYIVQFFSNSKQQVPLTTFIFAN